MICEVLKTIQGDGITYNPGEKVDVSEWRWAMRLVQQRKLRPILSDPNSPVDTEIAAVFTKRGRPRKVVTASA